MSAQQKDKRTKEQILQLLDNAIEQEERLGKKIKTLETELTDCRKKAEDPRHEMTEEAMSASKVSFRIDYYRTSEESPLRGIIEHLPSRQKQAFEGENQEAIGQFIALFLNEETGSVRTKKTTRPHLESSDLGLAKIVDKASLQKMMGMESHATIAEGKGQQWDALGKTTKGAEPAKHDSRLLSRLKSQMISDGFAGRSQLQPNELESAFSTTGARKSRLMKRLLKQYNVV